MPGRKTETHSHTFKAEKGASLTLDEIAEFVDQARAAGIPADSFPVAKVRMSGKVHELTVKTDAPSSRDDLNS